MRAPAPAAASASPARRRLLAVAPALLALAVYANSLGGDFVWDDRRLILDDRAITSWRQLGVIFTNDFFYRAEDDLPYGYYRPLTTLTYLIDYSLWRLDPFGFHLTNVVLHLAAVLLGGALLRRLGWSPTAAALAAALFAVHPIHTENVTWISGRTDVLAFVLTLAALWPWSDPRRAPTPAGRVASVLLFLAALLAKEMAVVLLFWVAAIERWRRGSSWRVVVARTLPFVLALLAYGVWRFAVLEIHVPGARPPEHTPWAVALSAPITLVRYLGWLLWPAPLQAYVIHPYVTQLSDPRLWFGLAGLTGLAVAALRLTEDGRRRCVAAMLAASFLPLLNLARVASPHDMGNTMAERFCYFPSFPFVALAALGLEALARRAPRAVGAAALAWLLAAAWLTVARAHDWRDEATFLETTLRQVPNATLLWRNLARHRLENEEMEKADEAIRRIEELAPGSNAALAARAHYFVVARRYAEAVPLQERIVAAARQSAAMATNNLAFLYRVTGNPDAAERLLRELIAAGRASGDVYFNLAEIERARGDNAQARQHLRLAWADRPHNRRIGALLATLESQAGDVEAARAIYLRLLSVFPDDPRLLNNLAIVEFQRGQAPAAIAAWQRALALAPDYADAAMGLAEALRRAGQGNRARQVLQHALTNTRDAKQADDLRRQLQQTGGKGE